MDEEFSTKESKDYEMLCKIKKNIKKSCEYNDENSRRFSNFMRFVFKTSMLDNDAVLLNALQKPQAEFSVLPAYISRQIGEFSKQEPSFTVSATNDSDNIDPKLIEFVEGYIRYVMTESNANSFEYLTYREQLGGGYSALKIWPEYGHEMGFEPDLKVGKPYDTLMTGHDPMAREPHKGDGAYCFEIFPMVKEEFEETFDIDASGIDYKSSFEGFEWSYKSEKECIILVADYYAKKKKRTKIVYLTNKQSLTQDDYEDYLKQWNAAGHIEQPAQIVKSRWTDITTICRYRIYERGILSYEETDYPELPIIYVPGDAVLLRDPDNKTVQEMTRPYVYHAQDAQRMKNFAGQTWLNEIENMVMHKFKVAEESIPEEDQYRKAYTNVQQADTLVYRAFLYPDPAMGSPPIPIPPPMEIQRVPMPPEVMTAYQEADKTIQAILGSYDAALGINDNQLSGVAIVEGATQSNAAAMPYLVGYMQAWQQLGKILLAMIPKYHVTPRTLPIIDREGKRQFVKINQNGGISIKYSPESLNIKVEAGVNYTIQKNKALQMMMMMAKAVPGFAMFLQQKALPILISNFDVRGSDQLKVLAEEFMKEQKAQQAQNAQNNPLAMKMRLEQQKLQNSELDSQRDFQTKLQQNQISAQSAQNDTMRIQMDAQAAHEQSIAQAAKAQAEEARAHADMGLAFHNQHLKVHDMHHKQQLDKANLAHEIVKNAQMQQSSSEGI